MTSLPLAFIEAKQIAERLDSRDALEGLRRFEMAPVAVRVIQAALDHHTTARRGLATLLAQLDAPAEDVALGILVDGLLLLNDWEEAEPPQPRPRSVTDIRIDLALRSVGRG
jgi:hypothetical protein